MRSTSSGAASGPCAGSLSLGCTADDDDLDRALGLLPASGERHCQRARAAANASEATHRRRFTRNGHSASLWIYRRQCFTGVSSEQSAERSRWPTGTGSGAAAAYRSRSFRIRSRPSCRYPATGRTKRSRPRRSAGAGRSISIRSPALLLADAPLAGPHRALSRALEPLHDPALLFLSDDGHAIARRGAVKEAPVDVDQAQPADPGGVRRDRGPPLLSPLGHRSARNRRAFVANLRGGGVRQGGSTITQQLAKTNFLSGDRTIKRKAQEVIIAFWLEAWLTKQEILSRYLSSVYFGDGVYGLRAAAHHYFRRDPENLSLAQSAMLAGMVQAPSRLAPTHNLARRQKRSRLVLQAMADTGAISAVAGARRPLRRGRSCRASSVPTGSYFADWVTPYAQPAQDARFRRGEGAHHARFDLQRLADARGQPRPGRRAQAALVAMRPDGRVVAMVGGKDLRAIAVQPRHPGAAPAGLGVQAVRLSRRVPRRLDARQHHRGRADHDRRLDARKQRRRLSRQDHAARGVRPVEQRGDGPPVGSRSGAATSSAPRAISASRPRFPTSPACALGTAGVSLLELTSAYAAVASGRYPVVARGLPDEQRAGRASRPSSAAAARSIGGATGRRCSTFSMRRRTTAPAAARRWRFRPSARPGRRRRTATPCSSASPAICGRSVGRPRRQQVARQGQRRHRSGAIWRSFMTSALAVDQTRGPPLPVGSAPQPQRDGAARARCRPNGAMPPSHCASWRTPSQSFRGKPKIISESSCSPARILSFSKPPEPKFRPNLRGSVRRWGISLLLGACGRPEMAKFMKLLKNDEGATAIEYGLIAALIAVAAIGAMQGIGNKLNSTFNNVSNTSTNCCSRWGEAAVPTGAAAFSWPVAVPKGASGCLSERGNDCCVCDSGFWLLSWHWRWR